MMAAHSIEGRFPFLDHRVVEFCNQLPPGLKIRGLREKHILKKSAAGLLPREIAERRKQPYRAPIHQAFVGRSLAYVDDLLSPDAIRSTGIFAPRPIDTLLRKCRAGGRVGEFEDMALVGVLSTQLLHHQFVAEGAVQAPEADPVRIYRQKERVR